MGKAGLAWTTRRAQRAGQAAREARVSTEGWSRRWASCPVRGAVRRTVREASERETVREASERDTVREASERDTVREAQ